ncbi:MAG: hypothetical protein KAG43_01210 [Candidatus Marithrix sp.]|nr:hypothetical protein [Candidatus Marithrix sp.]
MPYQESVYAYIEYTAPLVLGVHNITIQILNENGDKVNENGLISRIEVINLPTENNVEGQLNDLPPDGKCGLRSSN